MSENLVECISQEKKEKNNKRMTKNALYAISVLVKNDKQLLHGGEFWSMWNSQKSSMVSHILH